MIQVVSFSYAVLSHMQWRWCALHILNKLKYSFYMHIYINKWFVFLSVVGVYVVRTSSLNDKHSCQLFRKAASFSSLVLFSSSVSTANLSCLLATTSSSLRFLFSFTSLQSFESGQALFLVVFYFLIFASYPQSSAFLYSVLQSLKLCLL